MIMNRSRPDPRGPLLMMLEERTMLAVRRAGTGGLTPAG